MSAFLLSALSVFVLRLMDTPLYTMRIMMVARGRKLLTWIYAFFQAIIYVSALRAVLSDLGDWGKVFGYVAGFATGMVLGMWLEERIAVGFTHLRIISPTRGARVGECLRESGYAVTEIPAQGREGTVTFLNCFVFRRDAYQVQKLAVDIDPDAFITSEAVRPLQRGYWRSRRSLH